MSGGPVVLVVEDEAYVRESMCALLEAEGFRPLAAGDVAAARERLATQAVEVVVCDLRLPGGDAFALLDHLAGWRVRIPVVVVSGVGTLAEAVRAMKAGAYDFLQKPIDPEELLLVTQRAHEHHRLLHEVEELRRAVGALRAPRALVGSSATMALVRERLAQVAPTDAPVLISGESGTGKELAAEELHAAGPHAGRPLRRVRCAAVRARALEDALAGRGADVGPGPQAGTLMLDEIGLLDADAQALLLRFLEGGLGTSPAAGASPLGGARVVATTNADLSAAVQAGAFRADLYWRLNVFHIEMPPLREHREDIPEIVEHFLAWERESDAGGGGLAGSPTPGALELMASYAWPGNVRELRNVLERAMIVAGRRPIDVELVRSVLEPALAAPIVDPGPQQGNGDLRLRPNLDAAEKDLVLRALARSSGLKKQAAYLLGIDPRNLGYYLRKHGIG